MKSQLIAIVAAVVLVGCSTTQSLHRSAQFGNIEAVKQYLDAGGDVNAKDRFENTPLHRGVVILNNLLTLQKLNPLNQRLTTNRMG